MGKPPTTRDLIFRFLEREGKPVPISDVIDYVLDQKSYTGNTPRKTVSSLIQRCARIKRTNGLCSLR